MLGSVKSSSSKGLSLDLRTALLQPPGAKSLSHGLRLRWPIPGHPKVPCFLEVFGFLKPTKKHSFGCPGRVGSFFFCFLLNPLQISEELGKPLKAKAWKLVPSWFQVQVVLVCHKV